MLEGTHMRLFPVSLVFHPISTTEVTTPLNMANVKITLKYVTIRVDNFALRWVWSKMITIHYVKEYTIYNRRT